MKHFRDPLVILQAVMVGGIAMGAASAVAADADCKAIADALGKQMRTPTHAWVTRTSEAEGETTSEAIFADGVQYVQQYNAWWRGATLKDIVAREKTIAANVTSRCERLPDETVGDVQAQLFRREDRSKADPDGAALSVLKIWISAKRGLPLREEFTFSDGDAVRSRIVKRFEYNKVRAPTGARTSPMSTKARR
ncbi:MAG: hypothetical protein ABIR62_14795 [Dokdonella sp.]|uniref:hypothetical protein n=1 Tax=Dokdonella sp. TaxID=2291710 RepID=UPI00326602F9